MAETKVPFGNRKGRVLCGMPRGSQLDVIADGLPIILASAQGFWSAAQQLDDHDREARVLEGFAEEEAAKIMILMDLVRCPPGRVPDRTGHLMRLFYDHLSRLIYSEAQGWKPMNMSQLREYVDHSREGHYLEGYIGEYIVPNWTRYSRESAMYADIEVHEDGAPIWSDPRYYGKISICIQPAALRVAEAMQAAGMFDRRGLQAVADLWGPIEFVDVQDSQYSRRLTEALFERLDAEGLVTGGATADHAGTLLHGWQMPMYNLDFRESAVSLDDLKAQRDANFWAEVGC